jgi:hypothetical protein
MNNKNNAKYAFYYLLSFVSLVFMALSVGMILFGIIDKTIIDAIQRAVNANSQLKFAISSIIISAPIFYIISYLINQGLRRKELEKDSVLRRWLSYFILLASSLVVLGSFISVINVFLSGEITGRFILKAITFARKLISQSRNSLTTSITTELVSIFFSFFLICL